MNDHVSRLRARLAVRPRQLLTVPGCWDALGALLIEQAASRLPS